MSWGIARGEKFLRQLLDGDGVEAGCAGCSELERTDPKCHASQNYEAAGETCKEKHDGPFFVYKDKIIVFLAKIVNLKNPTPMR